LPTVCHRSRICATKGLDKNINARNGEW